jgi:hypothetical protein
LLKLNVANPAAPALLGRLPLTSSASTVVTAGPYVVVGDSTDVVVVDAGSLAELGRLSLPDYNQAWGLAVSGDTVFAAAGRAGVCSIGVAGGVPKLHACLDTEGEALGVAGDGQRLYVADSGNGVVVLNVADPLSPQLLGRYPSAWALKVAVDGSQLFVSDFNNGDGRLLLLDRGAGAGLDYAGEYDTRGFVEDIAVRDGLIYLANQEGLEVLQRLSAASLGDWAWYPSAGGATGVVLNASQVYLMDGANGLLVLDVTPAATQPAPALTPTAEPGQSAYTIGLPIIFN